MASLTSAAFDPIFFLNHNFVEKVYEEWQLCREKENDNDWYQNVEQRNQPLQCFDNEGINQDNETLGITMEALLLNKEDHCYRYDTLSCNCEGINRARTMMSNTERKYLVFNKRNPGISATFKFNVCIADNRGYISPCSKYVQGENSVSFFGNEKQTEGYELYYHDITDALKKGKYSLIESDVYIEETSFQDTNGIDLSYDIIDPKPYDVYRPSYESNEYYSVQYGIWHNTTARILSGTYLRFIAPPGCDLRVGEFKTKEDFYKCNREGLKTLEENEFQPKPGPHFYAYFFKNPCSEFKLQINVFELPIKCGSDFEYTPTTTATSTRITTTSTYSTTTSTSTTTTTTSYTKYYRTTTATTTTTTTNSYTKYYRTTFEYN